MGRERQRPGWAAVRTRQRALWHLFPSVHLGLVAVGTAEPKATGTPFSRRRPLRPPIACWTRRWPPAAPVVTGPRRVTIDARLQEAAVPAVRRRWLRRLSTDRGEDQPWGFRCARQQTKSAVRQHPDGTEIGGVVDRCLPTAVSLRVRCRSSVAKSAYRRALYDRPASTAYFQAFMADWSGEVVSGSGAHEPLTPQQKVITVAAPLA